MSDIYENSFDAGSFSLVTPIDSHVPNLTFDDGSHFTDTDNDDFFSVSVFSSDTEYQSGDTISSKIIQSKSDKANALGLKGQEFANYVENDIAPSVKNKRDIVVAKLTTPPEDITHAMPSSPTVKTDLIGAIKDIGNNQNDILSEILDSQNHLTTLLQNQNQIMVEANQIALEKNKIDELSQTALGALSKVLVESLTSMGQSLEYLPSLIETIAVGSEKQAKLQTDANSHSLQKNVNDAYIYNANKDGEEIKTNALASIATNHDKVGALAIEEKEIIDEENSEGVMQLISDFGDAVYDTVTGELLDHDIFTYLLNNTTEVGGKDNDY